MFLKSEHLPPEGKAVELENDCYTSHHPLDGFSAFPEQTDSFSSKCFPRFTVQQLNNNENKRQSNILLGVFVSGEWAWKCVKK